jgi:hypothetical protein
MKLQLTIDQEAADRITLLNLRDWRKYLIKENKDLAKKFPLPDHRAQDMVDNKKYIQALDIVIGAYEPPKNER